MPKDDRRMTEWQHPRSRFNSQYGANITFAEWCVHEMKRHAGHGVATVLMTDHRGYQAIRRDD